MGVWGGVCGGAPGQPHEQEEEVSALRCDDGNALLTAQDTLALLLYRC